MSVAPKASPIFHGSKVRPENLDLAGQLRFARHTEIGRSAGDADIEVSLEKIGQAVCQAIGSHEEHCFEFRSLDVLDVKDAHFASVAHDPPLLAANNWDIALCEKAFRALHERIDQFVAVDENGDRWKPTDTLFDFVNALCEPGAKRIA
jgi:hypothetical protein